MGKSAKKAKAKAKDAKKRLAATGATRATVSRDDLEALLDDVGDTEAVRSKAVEAREAAADVLVAGRSFGRALRVDGEVDLAEIDPRATPAFPGDKAAGKALIGHVGERLSDLQERLWAEGRSGGGRSVLLIVQGMDTSGKGGIMRHVVSAVDPQGVETTAFGAPTAEELEHPFLWRIRKQLPRPGTIGVFDRSHYEDVLVARVRELVPRQVWARRFHQINQFESGLVNRGTTVVKVMLHISREEQADRLAKRLDRADKHWKYDPGDLDDRAYWHPYQEAYEDVLRRCSTDAAPWHVVPADRKWYARLAVMNLLQEHLEDMDPQWPSADFDVEEEKERLAQS